MRTELNWLDMSINAKKSNCIRIGPRIDAICRNVTCLSGKSLPWVNEVRYLGIYIVRSRIFKCSLDYMRNFPTIELRIPFLEKWAD